MSKNTSNMSRSSQTTSHTTDSHMDDSKVDLGQEPVSKSQQKPTKLSNKPVMHAAKAITNAFVGVPTREIIVERDISALNTNTAIYTLPSKLQKSSYIDNSTTPTSETSTTNQCSVNRGRGVEIKVTRNEGKDKLASFVVHSGNKLHSNRSQMSLIGKTTDVNRDRIEAQLEPKEDIYYRRQFDRVNSRSRSRNSSVSCDRSKKTDTNTSVSRSNSTELTKEKKTERNPVDFAVDIDRDVIQGYSYRVKEGEELIPFKETGETMKKAQPSNHGQDILSKGDVQLSMTKRSQNQLHHKLGMKPIVKQVEMNTKHHSEKKK